MQVRRTGRQRSVAAGPGHGICIRGIGDQASRPLVAAPVRRAGAKAAQCIQARGGVVAVTVGMGGAAHLQQSGVHLLAGIAEGG